jgi:hypothetical protein
MSMQVHGAGDESQVEVNADGFDTFRDKIFLNCCRSGLPDGLFSNQKSQFG